MTAKRITSVDVARHAGVSQATVSRVFSNSDLVSPETYEKVMAAAHKLGYTPNVIARSLITHSTNIVGLVMADITSPFYPYVLEKFSQRLQEEGRQVLLFNAAPGKSVDDLLPLALQYQVDALVITSATLSSEMADECVRQGTPVILFNRYVVGARASAVCCDNVGGGRLAADVFIDAGHQRLAYIAGRPDTSTNTDREKGFVGRLRERRVTRWLREQGFYTYESGFDSAKRLLERDDPPDAIFCANDIMALGAMDAARHELGIDIPGELSILGFDDIPAAAWPSYDLTTIRQPVDRMIDATIDLLEERLTSSEAEPVLEFVPGSLMRRSSARLPDAID
jgi:DNA-binding LacI/PurR family transcriptional regulator